MKLPTIASYFILSSLLSPSLIIAAPVATLTKTGGFETANPIIAFSLTRKGAENFGKDYSKTPEGRTALADFDKWLRTPEGKALVHKYKELDKDPYKWTQSDGSNPEESLRQMRGPLISAESKPSKDSKGSESKPSDISKSSKFSAAGEGYRNVAYFVNWAGYGRKHFLENITTFDGITHVLYSFAKVLPDGTVEMTDPHSDWKVPLNGDAWDDDTNHVSGNVKALYRLKQANRNMKVLLSIGGWGYCENGEFTIANENPEKRARFASTAVEFVKDMGFDGIDVDWEYPKDDTDAKNFVALLAEIRRALDEYSKKHANGYHFELTVATPVGPVHYNTMRLGEMDQHLDAFHLMGYDYAGPGFSDVAGHQANLYPSIKNPGSTPFSTDKAIKDYIKAGVSSKKIVLGMGTYGRAFQHTEGIGKTFSGGGGGEYEQGVWDYKSLPKPGATEFYDEETVSAGSYDPETKELITYDTPKVIEKKIEYIKDNKLGGSMWWETSGDRNDGKSLIGTAIKGLGKMLQHENLLDFPESKYSNLRDGLSNS